jgi:soluble lytic murein transglycosylase-like protein
MKIIRTPTLFLIIGSVAFMSASQTFAGPAPAARIGKQSPITIQCVHHTNNRYGLPKNLLWAIKEAEGAGNGVVSTNRTGTKNLGSWQHNTITLPELRKYGVTGEALLNSECAAAYVAGWKLAKAHEKFKSWKLAVAAYNAGEGSVLRALKKNPAGHQEISSLDIPPLTKNIYLPHVETALLRFAQEGEPGARNE